MMHLFPEIVREEKLAEADDEDRTGGCVFSHPVNRTSKNGVTGTPSLASAEKGAQVYQWMCEDFSSLLHHATQEEAPLNHSYFESVL